MPDSPHDPKKPAKRDLPTRRATGEKPRAFADQSAEPLPLPSEGNPLAPAPADILSRRAKSSLPTERKKDRGLPSLTPAPYQAEPTPDATPGVRAELPGPRRPDEAPKFRPPTPAADLPVEINPAPEATTSSPQPATHLQTPADSTPPTRPAKHRLANNRVLELTKQGAIEADPELTDAWGTSKSDADVERRRSRRLLIWATLIGAPLAAFALWQSLGRPGANTPPITAPTVRPPGSAEPAEESRQAAEIVRQFLATKTVDERAAFVRHPETTKPRMEKWYTTANPVKPLTIIDFRDRTTEQTLDDTTFLMLTMETSDRYERAIALEKLPNGKFLVDWESYVFWSDPRWQEFLSKPPTDAHEFRVTLKISDYWNYAYANPEEWFCYKLEDPEAWAHCWGYCPINSEAGLQLNRLIRRQRQQGQDTVKAILKLKFEPGGIGKNQVLIEEVVQDGWIKPGS